MPKLTGSLSSPNTTSAIYTPPRNTPFFISLDSGAVGWLAHLTVSINNGPFALVLPDGRNPVPFTTPGAVMINPPYTAPGGVLPRYQLVLKTIASGTSTHSFSAANVAD